MTNFKKFNVRKGLEVDGVDVTASTLSGLSDTTITSSDPLITSNPTSGKGHVWVNDSDGEMYVLTDATANNNVWMNVGVGTLSISPGIDASGGTKTQHTDDSDGLNYTCHTFTSSGTFSVASVGPSAASIDYLIVAAGGGGGGHLNGIWANDPGGGGGAPPPLLPH